MPGILNQSIFSSIRASCQYALEASNDVRISESALQSFASNLSVEAVLAASEAVGLPVRFASEQAEVNFLALLALLNFGSEYDSMLLETSERDARESIQFGLLGMHITGSSLDAQYLKDMSNFNIASYFGIVTHLDEQLQAGIAISRPGPLLPFAQKLREVMNETGRRVEELGFTSLGEFVMDIVHRSPGGRPSAAFLVEEVSSSIPGFSDISSGTAEHVAFHKQAQSLAETLHRRFGQLRPDKFHFEDADMLTADSGIETVEALRSEGILILESELAGTLDAGAGLTDDGAQTIAMRAAAVVVVDKIVELVRESGAVTAQQISTFLQSKSKDRNER